MGRVTIYIDVTKLSYTHFFSPQKNLLDEIQTKINVSGPHKMFKNYFLCGEKRCVTLNLVTPLCIATLS